MNVLWTTNFLPLVDLNEPNSSIEAWEAFVWLLSFDSNQLDRKESKQNILVYLG